MPIVTLQLWYNFHLWKLPVERLPRYKLDLNSSQTLASQIYMKKIMHTGRH